MEWLAIFLGGGLGSLARYGMSLWLGSTASGFPLGTLAANLAACVVLGFLGGMAAGRMDLSPAVRLGAMVGFCGGFSTFSTFSNETLGLFSGDKPLLAFIYISTSVILCLGGIFLGQWLAKAMA